MLKNIFIKEIYKCICTVVVYLSLWYEQVTSLKKVGQRTPHHMPQYITIQDWHLEIVFNNAKTGTTNRTHISRVVPELKSAQQRYTTMNLLLSA